MKKDFETFLNELDQSEINQVWQNAEKERRKRNIISCIVILIIDAIIISFILNIGNNTMPIAIMPCFGACLIIDIFAYVIISVIFSKNYKRYNDLYKENIINNLLKNFFTEVDYVPKKMMSKSTYTSVFREFYDDYRSDDYIDAFIDEKYRISMAEVKTTKEERRTDSDGNTTTTTVTVFSGIFAKIDIGKSINNEVRITQNNAVNKKEKINMDSDEFEKYFDVKSTDNIVAMQLLTHDIMSLLVDFRKVLKEPYEIVINNDTLYIRLHVGFMFEGRVNKKEAIDRALTQKYYDIVDFIDTLSKEMIKVVEDTEV